MCLLSLKIKIRQCLEVSKELKHEKVPEQPIAQRLQDCTIFYDTSFSKPNNWESRTDLLRLLAFVSDTELLYADL